MSDEGVDGVPIQVYSGRDTSEETDGRNVDVEGYCDGSEWDP